MRLIVVSALLASAAIAAGCKTDSVDKPTGPVTLSFITPVDEFGDTAHAEVVMDGTVHITVPGDPIQNVTRGTHTFTSRIDISYLTSSFSMNIDPPGDFQSISIGRAISCRVISSDQVPCAQGNVINWRDHTLVFCPTNDYGAFCSVLPDPDNLGGTWPDSIGSATNSYLFHGKLLIGALRARDGGGTDTLAMAFLTAGDYAPHVRLHAFPNDSSHWQEEVWTDARHMPLAPQNIPVLGPTDRPGKNFGLSVRATAYLPPSEPNAMLLRFDIKNISATDSFRFVHPEEPAAGHTLTNIYLAPFWDADIGGVETFAGGEQADDNSTMFPAESLLVTYDQTFSAATMTESFRTRPGLFGLQLIDGPPGTTAKGIITSTAVAPPNYIGPSLAAGPANEDTTYALLSAGRAAPVNSFCTTTAEALVCDAEVPTNSYTGWSVGPIPSLAPGESTSITVGLLFAPPDPGTFTTTTSVPPQNDQLTNTGRTIYLIAGGLRALAARTSTLTVDGTPALRR